MYQVPQLHLFRNVFYLHQDHKLSKTQNAALLATRHYVFDFDSALFSRSCGCWHRSVVSVEIPAQFMPSKLTMLADWFYFCQLATSLSLSQAWNGNGDTNVAELI